MPKPIINAITVIVLGLLFCGTGMTQQTPPSHPQPVPSAQGRKAPVAKSQSTPAAKSPSVVVLKTQQDKTSYAIGLNIGENLRRDSVSIDPNVLLRGIKDALAGGKPLLTEDELKAAMMALQTDLRNRQEAKMKHAAETNKKEGQTFLASNKTKAGVVTLPSGLQYKVITEGSGPKPTAADSVVCNYRGTLLDKTEFDSSYKRGQPATFPVGQVIRGWTEALQLMPVGSKWQLFIPADLAYGERGAGADIGPNATLIFEVELISIAGKGK